MNTNEPVDNPTSDHGAVNAKYPILAFFAYGHLPPGLQEISRPFSVLAWQMAEEETRYPAEVAAGLRKLLEAKDCAVRAAL